jgi:hypothetical protein
MSLKDAAPDSSKLEPPLSDEEIAQRIVQLLSDGFVTVEVGDFQTVGRAQAVRQKVLNTGWQHGLIQPRLFVTTGGVAGHYTVAAKRLDVDVPE